MQVNKAGASYPEFHGKNIVPTQFPKIFYVEPEGEQDFDIVNFTSAKDIVEGKLYKDFLVFPSEVSYENGNTYVKSVVPTDVFQNNKSVDLYEQSQERGAFLTYDELKEHACINFHQSKWKQTVLKKLNDIKEKHQKEIGKAVALHHRNIVKRTFEKLKGIKEEHQKEINKAVVLHHHGIVKLAFKKLKEFQLYYGHKKLEDQLYDDHKNYLSKLANEYRVTLDSFQMFLVGNRIIPIRNKGKFYYDLTDDQKNDCLKLGENKFGLKKLQTKKALSINYFIAPPTL